MLHVIWRLSAALAFRWYARRVRVRSRLVLVGGRDAAGCPCHLLLAGWRRSCSQWHVHRARVRVCFDLVVVGGFGAVGCPHLLEAWRLSAALASRWHARRVCVCALVSLGRRLMPPAVLFYLRPGGSASFSLLNGTHVVCVCMPAIVFVGGGGTAGCPCLPLAWRLSVVTSNYQCQSGYFSQDLGIGLADLLTSACRLALCKYSTW